MDNKRQGIFNLTLIEVMIVVVFIFLIGFVCKKGVSDEYEKLSLMGKIIKDEGISIDELPDRFTKLVQLESNIKLRNEKTEKQRREKSQLIERLNDQLKSQRIQVENYKNKLSEIRERYPSIGAGIGTGIGSCWRVTKASGRTSTQNLFVLKMEDTYFRIIEAWPPSKSEEIRRAGFLMMREELIGKPFKSKTFKILFQPLSDYSRNQAPECRFLVQYRDETTSKYYFKKQLALLSELFIPWSSEM